jgi:hypothetical protein
MKDESLLEVLMFYDGYFEHHACRFSISLPGVVFQRILDNFLRTFCYMHKHKRYRLLE